jgi:hypothetical protein
LRTKYLIVVGAFALVLPTARAAETQTAEATSASDLASLLEGEFTTAPPPSESAGTSGTSSPQPLYELAKQVPTSPLGRYVVYEERREGALDGHIVSRTLSVLDTATEGSQITMTVYVFTQPDSFSGAYADPGLLGSLKTSDIERKCKIVWRRADAGFAGQSDGSCPAANHATSFTVGKAGLKEGDLTFRRLR